MTKLAKADVALNGLLPRVAQLISDDWQPGKQATEIAYRNSLLKYLRDIVPEDCRVEREYRHSGTTTDIYISWKGILASDEIFIEIKRNLQKKTVFNRLVGQIEELNPGKHKIILLLTGYTDEAFLGRLKSRYKRFMVHGMLYSSVTMAIIVKQA